MFPPLSRLRGIVPSVAALRHRLFVAGCTASLAFACEAEPQSELVSQETQPRQQPAEATYVGSGQCAQCHASQTVAWTNSHHDLAMQEPTPASALGRFDDTEVRLNNQIWKFVANEAGAPFRVRVPEADGEPRLREVAYVFGVTPLQQYLVRADGGRLQSLPVAWDSRSEADGGQRWFHLYEGEALTRDDSLHWTGRLQTWNQQCASCHSTNLEKRYDEATDTYDTRWAELDIGCEGCHGRASRHVIWAQAGEPRGTGATDTGLDPLRGKRASQWSFAPGESIAARTPESVAPNEIEACAPCHSRRSSLTETGSANEGSRSFLDGYSPSLLEPDLYFDDGQIRDEVYVWGSFVQSRMYAAGVTCTDCHDPHSLKVRGGADAVCSNCHAPATFAASDHHGHVAGSDGASCVACHMPSRVYMGVDARRDHSIRVPRPDLSEQVGAPDACTSCHNDRSPRWATDALAARGALRSTLHPASAIHAARAGKVGAQHQLAAVVANPELAAIARATAASLLDTSRGAEAVAAVRGGLTDASALVRIGALRALERIPPSERVPLAAPLLRDPVAAVRVEAARILVPAPPGSWPPGTRAALADALGEYRASQLANSDRFEAQLNLSVLEAQLGRRNEAIRRAERALEFEPAAVAARVNLADLLRAAGREDEAESALRAGLESAPESAELHFALGLSLVRQGLSEAALDELSLAAGLAPQTSHFAYTHAIALHSLGRSAEAVEALEAATRRSENAASDASLLFALATIERDRGNHEAAIDWAERLAESNPGDPRPATLFRELGKR